MASVTSLDADMRKLRLSRYTPQAAAEARAWIETSLGTALPAGDLLEALRDGTVLCQLANKATAGERGAIKWKRSAMPFIQMENISHFLTACERAPLSLPAHDRFLTVDLYEGKDAAQVLQCLGAFSRQANRINPRDFPTTIGPKKAGGAGAPAGAARALSPSLTGTSTGSASSQPSAPVSSWSKKSDEGATAPAWNIHQYGYMGGASQGNQGITFGGRRQITTPAPSVPSLAEKERIRREKEADAARKQQEEQERQARAAADRAREEEQARHEEERRWEAETERQREEERQRLERQKQEWEAQEKQWKDEEEARKREEAAAQSSTNGTTSGILRGQTLAEYHKEQAALSRDRNAEPTESPEQKRVRELEKQLEEARERERQYQAEREERLRQESGEKPRPSTAQAETSRPQSEASWAGDEREFLRQQWQSSRETTPAKPAPLATTRPLPSKPEQTPSLPARPLPEPAPAVVEPAAPSPALPSRTLPPQKPPVTAFNRSPFSRPLPTPAKSDGAFVPAARPANRTDQFLAANAAPTEQAPRISASQEAGDTSLEQSRDRDARLASQQKTKAGGWAGKSLLEREMERERERQREWEANQQAIKDAPRDTSQGTGQGQTWDVNQYGYMGGDNMNRGSGVGSGINFGGRRPIIGPRPKP